MKWIGRPLAEIWPFEIFPNVRLVGRSVVNTSYTVLARSKKRARSVPPPPGAREAALRQRRSPVIAAGGRMRINERTHRPTNKHGSRGKAQILQLKILHLTTSC